MNNFFKGFCNRWVSASSFGLIPLFSIPVMTAGMQTPSILVYRFAFGCLGILLVLMWKRVDLHIDRRSLLEICLLALFYDTEALLMILGYQYLPSGVATTLVFSYPIWTELLMLVFFHERFSWSTLLALTLAFLGVSFMSGWGGGEHLSPLGIVIELAAGLSYSFYMVAMPHLKVRNMGSLKLTFYVFIVGMVMFVLVSIFFLGGVQPIMGGKMFVNLLLLGLVSTALSNVTLIPAINQIGATLTAILGAFEPLTAMIIGILVFGDHLTPSIALGFALIIGAVVLLILSKIKTGQQSESTSKR
jgi:drug/metabolite transporter (DMT)-like permease